MTLIRIQVRPLLEPILTIPIPKMCSSPRNLRQMNLLLMRNLQKIHRILKFRLKQRILLKISQLRMNHLLKMPLLSSSRNLSFRLRMKSQTKAIRQRKLRQVRLRSKPGPTQKHKKSRRRTPAIQKQAKQAARIHLTAMDITEAMMIMSIRMAVQETPRTRMIRHKKLRVSKLFRTMLYPQTQQQETLLM